MRVIAILVCCMCRVGIAHADDPVPTLVVTLASDGTIVVGATVVADDKLDAKFRELAAAMKDPPLMVDADHTIERKRVDAIVARAKAGGLTHVTVGHVARPPPRPSR